MQKVQRALVTLGANMPREGVSLRETLLAAVAAMQGPNVALAARSRLFATPCFPVDAGPDYVNAAVVLTTGLSAVELLAHLHRIEADFGRHRVQRWGQRTLDLDLIALGDQVLPDAVTQRHWRDLAPEDQSRLAPDQLILPHPRLQDRAFVLVPLADIAPDWRHPLLDATVQEMLDRLEPAEVAAVKPL